MEGEERCICLFNNEACTVFFLGTAFFFPLTFDRTSSLRSLIFIRELEGSADILNRRAVLRTTVLRVEDPVRSRITRPRLICSTYHLRSRSFMACTNSRIGGSRLHRQRDLSFLFADRSHSRYPDISSVLPTDSPSRACIRMNELGRQ
jgi:hypothetical protein